MKSLALLGTLLLAGSAFAAAPRDTLVVQEAADTPTLDPGATYDTASGEIVENIYETLLTYRGNSLRDLKPLLATGWTVSGGGKTYTFDLRKNVKFHSGNPFTCRDAEYSFERNLVTNSAGSGNWFISESLLGTGSNAKDDKSITWAKIDKAVECNNNGQLVFTLPKVDPAFLAKLAFVGQSIVDSKHATGLGEWNGTEADWKNWIGKDLQGSKLNAQPSGTGAYRLVRRDPNTILLQAFPNYWGGPPAIKNVLVQKVPELAARQQAFLRGDADIIEGGGRSVDERQVKGKPGVTWVDNLPNTFAEALFLNEKIQNPKLLGSGKLDGRGIPANFFSDVNVRRCFAYAFNYGQYIQDVQRGKGKQRTMLLPDTFPGYAPNVKTYRYDPAQAKAACQQAWGGQMWQNGFILNANYRTGSVPAQTAMEILKKNLEALNPRFHIHLQPKQWSEMLTDANQGKEAIIPLGWAPDYADPDNFMYTFYSSGGYFFPASNWKDAQVDQWLEQARTITNQAERSRLYSLVGQRAYEQAPYVLLPAPVNYTFYRDTLLGAGAANFNPMTNFLATGTHWKDLSKK
ncbi:ABC transporter substrate-binding protein [Deinococcus aluminii]|uniref:Heme-binding protein A n=1 Tax=Deinococcus aluminii TaxID=1656885 RepID=A0ABP9XIG5_9DEIO